MMDDKLLVAAIEQHENSAETYGNLQEDRSDALDYYLGKPLGNEVEGRSQVIARQVWDTVEWIKPQLAEVFCSGEEIVAFAPRGPEDVKGAEQESDYVSYVITQRNPWFEIWYSWSHDALIQKNGYVKVYWDDSEDTATERYSNLTNDEFALLMQDKDIAVVEHSEEVVIDEMGGAQVSHTVKLERTKPRNVVRIENVAPEHIRVDQNTRTLNLQDPRVAFVQHAEFKTISELRGEGFDVPDDIQDGGENAGDWEEDQRDDYSPFRDRDGNPADPAMRRVKVRETWVRFDYDEDGRSELRHVILVGTTVLHNEECEVIPIVALCPTPMSHRHYGLSLADAVMDLQRIQTALLRGALDNQYLANNGRYGVNENNVNLDDMLDSRPGGVVRVNGAPGENLFPLTHSTNGQIAIPMMEYMDRIAQKRTGVNEQSQGLDPNALNKTATGAQMLMSAAQQRIKFIARIFAETGVRSLFNLVHQITLQHSRQQEMVELRGQWVPVDPRTWVKRKDMTVSMSLGTGDRPQQIALLSQIALGQEKALAIGLATPKNIYNTMTRLVKAMGYKDATEFWTDPDTAPPRQSQPDPRVVVEQMRQQADIARFQAESQMTQQLEQMKLEFGRQKASMELEVQAANDQRDSERELMKAQYDAQIEQMKVDANRQIAEMNAGVEKYRADLASQTQIFIKKLEMGMNPIEPMAAEPAIGVLADNNAALVGAIQAIQAQNEASAQRLEQFVADAAMQMQGLVANVGRPRQVVRGPDGKISGVM